MEFINFSCMEVFPRFYGGSEKKLCVKYNDEMYMLKFPKKPNERDRSSMEISYSNNVFSEYISCKIFESVGLPVQEVLLGRYKDKDVVACLDFVKPDEKLVEFDKIKVSYLSGSSNGQGTELNDILNTIETHSFINNKAEVIERFWDMFVMDALLANFDRHNGNWGFLVNEKEHIIKLAPVYDCGSCLLPRLSDNQMQEYLNNSDEFNKRIFTFPNAAIKLNNQKINFHNYLTTTENRDCEKALARIVPRIDFNKINSIIDDTPGISETRREFYKKYLKCRYDKILAPSLQRVQENESQMRKSIRRL